MSEPLDDHQHEEWVEQHQRESLRSAGVPLDGTPFLVLMEAYEPLRETVLCCGIDPVALSEAGSRPTGLNLAAIQFGEVLVVRYEVVIQDDPQRPLSLSCLVSPQDDDTRHLLDLLSEQDTVQLAFYDPHGAPLKRRILLNPPEQREGLKQVLRMGAGTTITPDQWKHAIDLATEAGFFQPR